MYIKEINIKSFGCLKDLKIIPSNRINVIYGANESGKSTLLSFILFMFYGTKIKKSNGELFFRQKIIPWNEKEAEGSIVFSVNGLEYNLRRTYSTHVNIVKLYCINTSEEIKDTQILSSPGKYFFGVNSESFVRSAFFSSVSMRISSENTEEIIKKLQNLFESSSTEVSYKDISERINNEISSLASLKRKNAIIPALENDILKIKRQISQNESNKEEKIRLNNLINKSDYELNKLTNELKTFRENIKAHGEINFSPLKIVSLISAMLSLLCFFLGAYKSFFYGFSAVFLLVLTFCLVLSSLKRKRKVFTINDFNDKIEEIQSKISDIKIKRAVAQERLDNLNTTDTSYLNNELKEKQDSLSYFKTRLNAYRITLEALTKAYNDMKTLFSPELSQKASFVLKKITDNKYSDILINDNFDISVLTEYGYNSALYLSRATLEQVYLSLRLALVDLVMNRENVPLFLDDAFAFYDTKRRNSALDFLLELSYNKQIFIATCKEDEYKYLLNNENTTPIYLK